MTFEQAIPGRCPEPVECGADARLGQAEHARRAGDAARLHEPIEDDQQFAYELLAEEKVLIVQGTGFNWATPDHFRIVFLPNSDDLTEAIGRIARFLDHYRRRHS